MFCQSAVKVSFVCLNIAYWSTRLGNTQSHRFKYFNIIKIYTFIYTNTQIPNSCKITPNFHPFIKLATH
ncbi:hypothetical protein P3S67_020037 [Capsicum chacoense]